MSIIMFKNQKGHDGDFEWQTDSETLLNGDILCGFYLKNKESNIGFFFKKKKGEEKFSYDEAISLENFKD